MEASGALTGKASSNRCEPKLADFGVDASSVLTGKASDDCGRPRLADLERVAALLCMTSGVGTSVSVVGAMVLTAKVAKSCHVSSAG